MHFLTFSALVCILSVLLFSVVESQVQKRPHIIYILADDLGWNDVSFHGSSQIPTPNIDALAFSGLILQNYYAQPLCTPSRSALMTGKHPINTGMQHDVILLNTKYGLPLNVTILPEHLKSLGYRNHLIGKWHLGHYNKSFTPNYRGFDSFYGYWSPCHGYYDHLVFNPLDGWTGYDFRRDLEVDWSAYGKYSTKLISDEAERVIQAHNSTEPLFLYVAHLAAHAGSFSPLQAPLETLALFDHIQDPDRRTFAAMVYELDKSIGLLIKALNDQQMLQDTIIVVSSDNGGAPKGLNKNAGSNWPLRGAKNTTWEGGVKVNGLIWSPLIPEERRGKVVDNLMDMTDWLPTLYEAAGGDPSVLGPIDGISQWDSLIKDLPSNRTQLLHNIDDIFGYFGLRKGNYKLVQGTSYGGAWDGWFGPSGRDNTTLQSDPEKYLKELMKSQVGQSLALLNMSLPHLDVINNLIKELEVDCGATAHQTTEAVKCLPLDGPCLFDVENDPCEYDNLADKLPQVVLELLDLLNEYNRTAIPPLNGNELVTNDPNANPKYWNCTINNWTDFPFDGSTDGAIRNCPRPILNSPSNRM